MRGTLRKKALKSGKQSLYIDYYPPVWNPQTKQYTRREYLNLHLHANSVTSLEKQENKLYVEIAEKIYLKRMKTLMLEENGIFNKDVLEGDFFVYAANFIRGKQKAKVDTTHYETAIKYLKNSTLRVSRISNVETFRQIIDDEELRVLLENPVEDDMVFRSSIFALLTSFRFSALKILKWSDFHYANPLNAWYVYIVDPKPEPCFKHYISHQL